MQISLEAGRSLAQQKSWGKGSVERGARDSEIKAEDTGEGRKVQVFRESHLKYRVLFKVKWTASRSCPEANNQNHGVEGHCGCETTLRAPRVADIFSIP